MNLMDLSATELATQVRDGTVTPQAAAAAARDRAAARNPVLNALTLINPALDAEAETVARRLAEGEDLPLAGVPVVIKDNIWVKDLPITQGSRLFEGFIAPQDATAVARLRRAGAVILGIGTCSEFACKGSTNTPLYGMTRNPLDLSRTPGGSSGGPVAAVAGGIVPLALGTDAGGSSRRPPAHVGIIGLKPTQDLIPYGPGFDEPVWGISVLAPLARTVADIRLAMAVLADLEPAEPLRGPLAFSADFGLGQKLDRGVAEAFDAGIAAIAGAGHVTGPAAPDWEGLDGMSVMPLQHAGLAALFGAQWRAAPGRIDPDLGAQIESGLALSGVAVAEAHHASHRIRTILRDFLSRHAALITPTTPCAAWPVELSAPASIGGAPCGPRDHAAFTSQLNHAGCPAITLPCGSDANGLPLAVQIMTAPGRDAELLALAAEIAPLLPPATTAQPGGA
ncbi:amidase [Salipiger mangrovisoli]|uniref:Amidase n=1 Tax=Salipiger mangrovisoli TaxID=2865933 RepID=A0ABR9X0W0_9RHOB|nr:amidase [Salipiger mangrovisoli]MBE9637176.1 amidase [Salipiger mangrovisoli]